MGLIPLIAALPAKSTVVACLFLVVPLDASQQKPKGLDLHPVEHQIVRSTNAQRARYGLQPLAIDNSLIHAARTHAQWMTRNRSLVHTHLAVAENIAMGQRTSAEVVKDWMGSPGHRANILSGSYRRIGVAAYVAVDGTIYWCQQFLP